MNKSKGVLRAVGSAKVYKYSTIAKEPPEVPKAYILPYLPDILDQGSIQSCVAHSVAESFQAQSADKEKFSVLGVYGLWRKHRGEGMYPETALDIGRTVGTTKREIAPENLEVPEAITKAKEYLARFPSKFCYRVGSFYKIDKDECFNPDYELTKRALLQFNAPLLALTEKGAHCEVCVGWVDKGAPSPLDGKKRSYDALIIQNSWGSIPNPRREEKLSNIEELYLVLMDKIKAPFTDIAGHWAEKYIENAYFAGYLNGRTETTFEPEGNVKRGEMAKVVSELNTSSDEKNNKLEKSIAELEKRVEELER